MRAASLQAKVHLFSSLKSKTKNQKDNNVASLRIASAALYLAAAAVVRSVFFLMHYKRWIGTFARTTLHLPVALVAGFKTFS